jgi:hypothetical protein
MANERGVKAFLDERGIGKASNIEMESAERRIGWA